MGTRTKGTRAAITVRVPPSHKQKYQNAAAEHGLDVSDYLALRLAEVHGLERPTWIESVKKPSEQGVLPDTE